MNTDMQEKRPHEGAHRRRHIVAWAMLALALAVSAVMGARWVGEWRRLQLSNRIAPDTAFYLHDVIVSTPSEPDVHMRLALLFILLSLVVFAAIPIVIAWRGSFWSSLTMTILMWMAWLFVLVLWPIFLNAPLGEPSNPFITPSPSRSRFMAIHEIWAHAAPWLLGVAVPLQGLILPLLISMVWVIYLTKEGGWPRRSTR